MRHTSCAAAPYDTKKKLHTDDFSQNIFPRTTTQTCQVDRGLGALPKSVFKSGKNLLLPILTAGEIPREEKSFFGMNFLYFLSEKIFFFNVLFKWRLFFSSLTFIKSIFRNYRFICISSVLQSCAILFASTVVTSKLID